MREPAARSRRSRSPAKPCRCPPRHRCQAPLRGALYARACGSESSISKPGQALPLPPPAPLPGPASWCPLCASLRLGVVDLEARPSPPALRHPPHRWGFHCCAHPIQAPPPTGAAAKPHSQVSLVPQLTCRPPHRRCLVCWWVIGVALKVGQAPPPTGTAAKPHSQVSLVPQLTCRPPHRRCLVCWVGDRRRFEGRPGPAAAPGYRSWAPAGGCMPCVDFQSGPLGGLQPEDLAGGVSPTCRVLV